MASERAVEATGFYGVPGHRGSKVHLVRNGDPICGARLRDGSRFQFCASGHDWSITECDRCLEVNAGERRRRNQ